MQAFHVNNERDIRLLTPVADPLASDAYGGFCNTALHYKIVNNNYDAIPGLLRHFSKLSSKMLTAQDSNGCTPLLLAMKVGAPPVLIIQMITPENAVMADKKGVTPLMLASRGMHTSIMEALITTIGSEKIQAALSAKDKDGGTVEDWNKASSKMLRKNFRDVTVDSTKAYNHQFNLLFTGTALFDNTCVKQSDGKAVAAFKKRYNGFELGIGYAENQPIIGLKATRKNIRLLDKVIDKSQQDARALIDPVLALSEQSLEDLYLSRQNDNKKLIDSVTKTKPPKNNDKEQPKASNKETCPVPTSRWQTRCETERRLQEGLGGRF
jgi:hypothetical protein